MIIRTRTKEEFIKLLEIYKSKNWIWYGLHLIEETDENLWDNYKEETALEYNDKFTFGRYKSYSNHEIVSFNIFFRKNKIKKLL